MTARAVAWAAAGTAAAIAASSMAQTVDVRRARTFVVGTPRATARVDRVDAARTGRSRLPLPASDLRTAWRAPLGAQIDVAPVVDGRATTYLVGTRGEVIAVGPEGSERWRVATGVMQPGPPALLSDDTLVFADAAGEAVAVRDATVRWRVHFGRADVTHPAPLALDDGGAVVATTRDLALLDDDGHERGRVTLPEPTSAPLAAALGKVVVVTASGTVWTWAPGAADLTRVGSFGGPVDGGAVLTDDHTLVAVTSAGVHLSAVDLVRGTTTTRAIAPAGLWLGPPATRDGATYLLLLAPASELALAIDASGAEILRAPLFTRPLPPPVDGGATTLVAPPHTPPLVDAAGTIAFATLEGGIGVVSRGGVDLLPDACPSASGRGAASAVVALAPLTPGTLVAVCRSGSLLALRGAASSQRADPNDHEGVP
jgi:hypothetical protein